MHKLFKLDHFFQFLMWVQMEKKVEEWEAEEAELKLAEFEAERCSTTYYYI